MNPSTLPQVPVLPCLAVVVPVGIALFRAKLLGAGMHYAVPAQYLIIGLALWIVIDCAPAIVATYLIISVNHWYSILAVATSKIESAAIFISSIFSLYSLMLILYQYFKTPEQS